MFLQPHFIAVTKIKCASKAKKTLRVANVASIVTSKFYLFSTPIK